MASSSTSSGIKRCLNDLFHLQRHNVKISVLDVMTSHSSYCVMELRSRPGTYLALTLNFVPHRESVTNCSHNDYIHVGNDRERINRKALTSYKYCNKTINEEIVSRGNYLWVVFRVSKRPKLFNIDVSSSIKAVCNSSQFQCSPVQCVSLDSVCDGVADCNNTRDEFCYTVPPRGPPCFRCGDGQCIRPQIPRYSLDHGKDLWYLCDGFKHCLDGTDERKDICYRIKGKTSSVISCVPSDVIHPNAHPVLMWNKVVCDGERDCYHGDDEWPEQCHTVSDQREEFHVDMGAVGFLVVFLITALVIGLVIVYIARRKRKRQRHGDSITRRVTMETGVTESEGHESVPLQSESEATIFDTVGLKQTTV